MSGVPTLLEVVGDELAVAWADGAETYLKLTDLRRLCPCAGCSGERDLLGRLAKGPARHLTTESFRVTGVSRVGGYAVQLFWGDGHNDGLYTYERLKEWGKNPPQLPEIRPMPLLPSR